MQFEWLSCMIGCLERRVIMMDEIPNGTRMVFQLFGEEQGFSDQSRDPLPERAIQALNTIGVSSRLIHSAMAGGREDPLIGFPKVRVTDGTLPVHRR